MIRQRNQSYTPASKLPGKARNFTGFLADFRLDGSGTQSPYLLYGSLAFLAAAPKLGSSV